MISVNYRCIRSTSANYLTFRYMEEKQRNETTIYVHGGLAKVSEDYRACRPDGADDSTDGDGSIVGKE